MYGEFIIGMNMVFNFAVLSFAKKIGHVQTSRGRLFLASFIGAVPVTIFPSSLIAVILSFFGMTIAAFGKAFMLWRKSATMVLIGAVFAGGLLTAFQYRIDTPSGNLTVLVYAVIAYICALCDAEKMARCQNVTPCCCANCTVYTDNLGSRDFDKGFR